MIKEFKKEGKLVPSEVVIELLKQAMQRSQNRKFLIDGFPRNEENRLAAEKMVSNLNPMLSTDSNSFTYVFICLLIYLFG